MGERTGEVAAILIEPMAGGGGAIPADSGFLRGLRSFADDNGIVLIFDEVMTSRLGRAGLQGEYGACVHFGQDISEDRLRLDPATPLCLDCAKGG